MTDSDNQAPVPSKQTSSVPLKKETVRVTLKAADAPPAVPSATVPLAPPARPPVRPPVVGGPPTPTAPAPTIPLRTVGKPGMAPAPTIRLASAAPTAPTAPTAGARTQPGKLPERTIRLASAAPTAALRPGGITPTLPKATVQLQPPTQPLGTAFPSSSQAATFKVEEEEEVEANAGVVNILASVGMAAALVVLALQLLQAKVWIGVEDNPKVNQWTQLFD